jgi:thioredoxin-like negative regulator of GroEL
MRVGFIAVLCLIPSLVQALPGLAWDPSSFEEAIAKAQKTDKWVLVDFTAGWCGPCHDMDEKVWSFHGDEVGRTLGASYVLLQRDGEKDEGAKLVAKYHVVGFPTLLVVDAAGNEVDRIMGFIGAPELTTTLQRFRSGRGTLAELEKRLASVPGDEALRFEVATRHAWRADARAPDELRAVVKGDPEDKKGRASRALLVLGKYYYLRGTKDYAKAVDVLRELEKQFPSSESAGEVGYQLGLALHLGGHGDEARKVLDAWLDGAGKDPSRWNAYAWLSVKYGFDKARGLEVAKKGLEANPKDDALWDTLAELHAASGRAADAREAEKKALALKPGDAYYGAQLRRFGGMP